MDTVSHHAFDHNPLSKYCTGCKQTLDVTCFAKDRKRADGLYFRCKECRNAYKRSLPKKPSTPEQRKIRLERFKKRQSVIVTKICEECNNPYQDRNGNSKFCSPCKDVRRKQFRPQTYRDCKHCGKQFGPVSHLKEAYCSKECFYADQSLKPSPKKGKKYPHTQRAAIHTCPSCGTEFRGVSDTKRKTQIYCCHACYLKERRVSYFEIRVMDLIESYGIPLERQVKRGKWSFDGAIANTPILIEADGHFWHSSAKVKERDQRKDQWCLDHGYILMRVPELDFYKDPVKTITPILSRWEKLTGQQATLLDRVEEAPHA